MFWSNVKMGVGRLVNRALRRFGLEIVFSRPQLAESFFLPMPRCQIPYLGSLFELFFGRSSTGVFVEVGAFDGYEYSNTSCLVDRGWSGILIEPVPEFAQRCRTRYAGNDNVEVVEMAVGAEAGVLSLTVTGAFTSARTQTRGRVVSVHQETLDRILFDKGVVPSFDLLVVDTEGFEKEVFEGFTLNMWQPRMLIVELADTQIDRSWIRKCDAQLAAQIKSAGYVIVFKDWINTVFVHEDLARQTFG